MSPLSTVISLYVLHLIAVYKFQCRHYSRKTVNHLYNYSTVLGAVNKCKTYSEITVESWTHLKTVKITLNIFAVYHEVWIFAPLEPVVNKDKK